MKFDVVVGNPPYSKLADGKTEGKTTSKSLWVFFVERALEIVGPGGVVSFVTPVSWIHANSRAGAIIRSKRMIFSRMFTSKDNPFKGVGTSASYWGIENVANDDTDNISIQVEERIRQFHKDDFIPATPDDFDLRLSILNKTVNSSSDKFTTVITSKYHTQSNKHKLSDTQTAAFAFPVFHSNTVTLWTSEKDELHNTPKVLISKKGSISKARVDNKHCVSQNTTCIVTATLEEAMVALGVIQSKLYVFMMETVRVNAGLPSRFYKHVPAVDLTRSWTDEELYAHFNLTDEEIKLIEDTIK